MSQENSINVIAMGFGQNESEAINNALRNCIERSYGVFITSSSTIENDSLKKDAIYQLGKGAIDEYEVMNKNKTSSGTEITVSATLSPHKIVSYVNAKSSSDVVKVNGNIFIQNILIEEFYMNQEKMIIQEFLKSRANLVFAKLTETNVNDPIFIEKSKFFGLYRHGQYIHYKNGLTADFDYVLPINISLEPTHNYYTFIRELYQLIDELKLEKAEIVNFLKHSDAGSGAFVKAQTSEYIFDTKTNKSVKIESNIWPKRI